MEREERVARERRFDEDGEKVRRGGTRRQDNRKRLRERPGCRSFLPVTEKENESNRRHGTGDGEKNPYAPVGPITACGLAAGGGDDFGKSRGRRGLRISQSLKARPKVGIV